MVRLRVVFVLVGNVVVGFVELSSLFRSSAKTALLCSRRLKIFLLSGKVGCGAEDNFSTNVSTQSGGFADSVFAGGACFCVTSNLNTFSTRSLSLKLPRNHPRNRVKSTSTNC